MYKILIEVKKDTFIFSLYSSHNHVENLNNTNVINTEKLIFSDKYIYDNLDLVKSFFNLIALKKEINKLIVNVNAVFPLAYKIIEDISSIKSVYFTEEKQLNYISFEYLLSSKYINNIDCYYMPAFMFDKLDIDKHMKVNLRCEILYISKFMEKNKFNNYSDLYYKKIVDIDCNLSNIDKDDIESFFRINNNLRILNLYNVNSNSIDFIFDLIKCNSKKNIKIILHQAQNNNEIIKFCDKITEKYKKLIKDNNLKLKINYTQEYRDDNMMKQVNLTFFRYILLIFVLIALLMFVFFNIKNKKDTENINDEMQEISEIVDLNNIDKYMEEEKNIPDTKLEDDEETQTQVPIEEPKEPEVVETKPVITNDNPYDRKFEQVFSELLKINDETVGWLKVNNTNINYPVTKHEDNDYYLNYSYYKKKNSHGWIFMDYRNSINPLNKNTIIYAHRNNQGVMFATLKNVLEKSWYTNKDNQIITFNTLNKDMKWQIFSIYTLKNTNDYLANEFVSDASYNDFLKKIKSRSIYDFGVEVGVEDNILTLSTCYKNAEYRLVVHAKLIK